MKKHLRLFGFAFCMLFIAVSYSGEEQSTIKSIFLNKNNINLGEKTRVMLHTSKFSIYPQTNQPAMFIQTPVTADPLSAMIGTLIAVAFINESNKSERDSAVSFNSNLNTALSNININDELELSLKTELSKNELFNKLEFEKVDHINELSQAGLLTRIEEKYILTLATRVHFDSQLKSLCLESSAKIWLKNQAKPIYFSNLTYSSAYLLESDKTELKKKWVSNNGELITTKIREGIADLSHMLLNDLSINQEIQTLNVAPVRIKISDKISNKELKTNFFIIEELPDRLIGRLGTPDSSLLTSIPKKNFSYQE